jgi:ATP-dependent DNA ligase
MPYPFSLTTKSDKVPAGQEWIHEIKYDGYRMMVVRDRDRVRLISRRGYDWADRFPPIVAGAMDLPQQSFAIDGEVVVLRNMGLEGIVSKHLDRPYGAGRCKHWIKIKNPAHPAYSRVREYHQSLRSRRSA